MKTVSKRFLNVAQRILLLSLVGCQSTRLTTANEVPAGNPAQSSRGPAQEAESSPSSTPLSELIQILVIDKKQNEQFKNEFEKIARLEILRDTLKKVKLSSDLSEPQKQMLESLDQSMGMSITTLKPQNRVRYPENIVLGLNHIQEAIQLLNEKCKKTNPIEIRDNKYIFFKTHDLKKEYKFEIDLESRVRPFNVRIVNSGPNTYALFFYGKDSRNTRAHIEFDQTTGELVGGTIVVVHEVEMGAYENVLAALTMDWRPRFAYGSWTCNLRPASKP